MDQKGRNQQTQRQDYKVDDFLSFEDQDNKYDFFCYLCEIRESLEAITPFGSLLYVLTIFGCRYNI